MSVQNPSALRAAAILLGALLALLIFAAATKADPEEWSPALNRQLNEEQSCKVLYMLNVREYRLFERDAVEARVQCEDGRSFDVIRRESTKKFEIAPCKPVAC